MATVGCYRNGATAMGDEVGSLMMSRVRGKVEPQEETEPDIVIMRKKSNANSAEQKKP